VELRHVDRRRCGTPRQCVTDQRQERERRKLWRIDDERRLTPSGLARREVKAERAGTPGRDRAADAAIGRARGAAKVVRIDAVQHERTRHQRRRSAIRQRDDERLGFGADFARAEVRDCRREFERCRSCLQVHGTTVERNQLIGRRRRVVQPDGARGLARCLRLEIHVDCARIVRRERHAGRAGRFDAIRRTRRRVNADVGEAPRAISAVRYDDMRVRAAANALLPEHQRVGARADASRGMRETGRQHGNDEENDAKTAGDLQWKDTEWCEAREHNRAIDGPRIERMSKARVAPAPLPGGGSSRLTSPREPVHAARFTSRSRSRNTAWISATAHSRSSRGMLSGGAMRTTVPCVSFDRMPRASR